MPYREIGIRGGLQQATSLPSTAVDAYGLNLGSSAHSSALHHLRCVNDSPSALT